MKSYILSILSLCLLLVGCQQEQLMEQQGMGYLSLESLTVKAVSNQPVTRAGLEEGLGFKVLDANNREVIHYAPNEDYTSQRFELAAGNYTLEAYNQAYLDKTYENWTNSELGEPIRHIIQPFTIETNKTNYLKVEVPMTNFAVCLESIQGEEFFQKFELIVSMGDRSLHLKKGEIGYFPPLVVDGLLYYYISYLNDDGEGQNGSIKTLTPTANAQYNFIYNVKTKTIQTNE
jgi:hypothetical protein